MFSARYCYLFRLPYLGLGLGFPFLGGGGGGGQCTGDRPGADIPMPYTGPVVCGLCIGYTVYCLPLGSGELAKWSLVHLVGG